MRLLSPTAEDGVDLARLVELYTPPSPWVRANFVSSLDGAAAGGDNLSESITNDADQQVFGVLRGLADVVLVGVRTVAAEAYRRLVLNDEQRQARDLAGLTGTPTLAVITASLDLPDSILDERPGSGEVLVVCPEQADPAGLERARAAFGPDSVVFAGESWVDLATAVDALAERGLPQVLCEGGPTVMAGLVAAGRLDELCLSWSPLVVGGSGPRILDGPPVSTQWQIGHLLEQDGVLISRWTRR